MQFLSQHLVVLIIFTNGTNKLKVKLIGKPSATTQLKAAMFPRKKLSLLVAPLDERTFKQEFLASFETFSGRVFPEFNDANIDDRVQDMGGPVLIGLDFNVSVMSGVICSKVGDTLHQWDEIAMKNSNTDEVAQMLRARFSDREIICYPDPSGRARKIRSSRCD